MKKIFGQTKKPAGNWKTGRGENYDWEEEEYDSYDESYEEENSGYVTDEYDGDEGSYEEEQVYDGDSLYEEAPEYEDEMAYEEEAAYEEPVYEESVDENGLDFDEIVYEEPVEDDRKVRPIFRDQPAHAGSAGSFRRGENYAQNTFYEREEEPYEEPSYEEEMPYNGETYEEGTAYEGQEYEEQPVYDGQDAYGQPAYGGQALYEEPVYEEPAYEEQQVYDDSVYNGEIIYEEPEGENYYSEEAPEEQADFGQTRVMYADRGRSRSKREIEDEILENEIYYQEEEEPVRPSGARAGRQAHAAGPQRGGNRKPSRQAYRREEEEDDRRGGGGLIDAIIALTGIAGVVLAVVIGIIYFQSKNMEDPAAQFANVGTQLQGIELIGGRGIAAVANAELEKIAQLNNIEPEPVEEPDQLNQNTYEENDLKTTVAVGMTMTSVQKDLKIKFTNRETSKLIGNVRFVAQVTKPDGTVEEWTDSDMDGIIYQKGIDAGKYVVVLKALDDSKYSNYILPSTSQNVTVKKDISYAKVDVNGEVKKESEINVKAEDTKKNETAVESVLTDTVPWVTSSVTGNTYTEVLKSSIPDPVTLPIKSAKAFMRTTATDSSTTSSEQSGSGTTTEPTQAPTDPSPETTPNTTPSTDPSPETTPGPTDSPSPTPSTAPSPTVTPSPSPSPSLSPSPSPTPTPGLKAVSLSLDKTSVELKVKQTADGKYQGDAVKVKATISGENGKDVQIATAFDNTKVALDVNQSTGEITIRPIGVSNTPIQITVEADYKNAADRSTSTKASAKISVSFNEEKHAATSIKLDKTSPVELKAAKTADGKYQGETLTLQTTVSGFESGKKVTIFAGFPDKIVSLAIDQATGKVTVTPVGIGKAQILIKADYENAADRRSNTEAAVTFEVNVVERNAITLSLDKADALTYAEIADKPVVVTATIRNSSYKKAELNQDKAAWKSQLTAETDNAAAATVTKTEYISSTDDGTMTVRFTVTPKAITEKKSTVLNIKYKEGGLECKAACTITIKPHPKHDTTTKLLDKDNKQLYVFENNNYREAVYADYYKDVKLFVQGGIKYTGWQTLNGKVYYFNADGKYVTGEQVIQGAKYSFSSDGVLTNGNASMGIDVSKWNGTIDWKAVKNSGVSFVIIRCGYRGSSQGALIEDPKFTANIKGASEAGLKVGVYFFTQAVDEVEAVYEASYVLDKIRNYSISYPVFLDVEASGGRGDKISKETRTKVCKAFCQTIQNGGYAAGIYANKTWLTEKINTGELGAFKIWLAQYASAPTYTGKYDIWQYKSTGSVSGISGSVDLNLSYMGY